MSNQNGITTNHAAAWRASRKVLTQLPSGQSAQLRKVPLQAWWAEGKLPQAFIRTAMKAQATDVDDANSAGPRDVASIVTEHDKETEQQDLMQFMLSAVRFAFVSPRIVEELSSEDADEILIEEISPEDFNFAFSFATHQLPGSTIATTHGEVTVKAVENFHPSGQHEPSAIPGDDVSEVRGQAV